MYALKLLTQLFTGFGLLFIGVIYIDYDWGGKSSNPTYTLAINKSDKTAICIGNNEPEFKLEKK